MTDEQKRIAEAYFDNEAISSRITAAQSNRINPAYAPYVSVNSPYYQLGVSDANRGNLQEAQPQTTTNTPVNGQVNGSTAPVPAPVVPPARSAPRTGINNTSPFSSLNIDTNIPGKIEVPSQRINVPLIWSKDPKNFDNDLKYGVIHYTGTAMPGDIGTSYISGHSSGSVFDRNPYREVFARIGNMANGTPFAVTVTMQGGKQAVLHYVVGGRAEYAANDQRQFLQTPESVMALSTCWPINTTARRLVVFGTLTRVDK
jgi:LPXTG-site transpeptidase (sortase) family protein